MNENSRDFRKISNFDFFEIFKKTSNFGHFFWKSPKNIFSRKSPKNQNFTKIHKKITVLWAAIQCSNKSRTQITHYNHTPRLCFLIWRFIFSKESSWFHAGIESASQSCKDSTVLPIGRGWNVVRLIFMQIAFRLPARIFRFDFPFVIHPFVGPTAQTPVQHGRTVR